MLSTTIGNFCAWQFAGEEFYVLASLIDAVHKVTDALSINRQTPAYIVATLEQQSSAGGIADADRGQLEADDRDLISLHSEPDETEENLGECLFNLV